MNHSNGAARPDASASHLVDRLMFGENIASKSTHDITHWIGAYSELLAFKDRLLIDMETGMQSLSQPAEHEIRELDVTLIVQQRERYIRRLDFWKGRQAEANRRRNGLA